MDATEKTELEEEIAILEYAHLQLANGYGDRVSRDDLAPIRRIIRKNKEKLKS